MNEEQKPSGVCPEADSPEENVPRTTAVETQTAPVKKRSKLPVILGCAAGVLVIAAILLVKVIIPSAKYSSAEQAFANGDYATAQDGFAALGSYKDAAEKAVLAQKAEHYERAENDFSNQDYASAYNEYLLAGDFEDAAEKAVLAEKAEHYQSAENYLSNQDYENAYNEYLLADDFEDAAAKIQNCADGLLSKGAFAAAKAAYESLGDEKHASYCDGMVQFDAGSYEAAEKLFDAADAVENASEMKNASMLMQAEEYMAKGYLNSALTIYEALPEGFSYNDISAADRIKNLQAHARFVELCGQWKSDNMDASVRQTHDSTGLWDQWDGDGWGYLADVTCVINSDDTVTITANANFWMYTNYSTLSKYLKNSDWSAKFTYTGKNVPYSIKLDSDMLGYAVTGTLTMRKNNFKLDYQLKDANSSMNFTYTYKAFGTYDTLVKAY